jgi:hypothetical protein
VKTIAGRVIAAPFFQGLMFDPSQMTVGQLVTMLRDGGILVSILVFGWKVRGLVQPLIDFFSQAKSLFERATRHMDAMETGMNVLLSNHLSHIEQDLNRLANPTHRNPEVI